MPKVIQILGLSFKKESPEKKASKESETKVNSVSDSDYIKRYIDLNRYCRVIGFSASAVLTVIMTLTVFPIQERTSTAEATTGTATESSTTITVNQATASIDLTAASADGTFAKSEGIGVASFGVKTTNYTGYTLTVEASDDAGTLTNTSGQGSFTTISGVLDEKTFDTSSYNGKWGYKPSKYNGIENVAYWPSPTTKATTLDITSSPNSTDNTYTIALGARAAYTQPTGTYSKTVILTATGNPSAYSITYTDNTGTSGTVGSDVTNLPDTTNSDTTATAINLSSVTPSRPGYVFDGWCTTAPTHTTSGSTCSGTKYNAGASYGIDQTTTNVVTLYATWKVPTYTITIKPSTGITSISLNGTSCTDANGCPVNNLTYGQTYTLTATANSGYTFSSWSNSGAGTIANLTSVSTNYTVGEGSSTITANATISLNPTSTIMQNFTKDMCQTYATDHGIVLTDARDNHSYSVRWINGNCWMTSNLAFGADNTNPDSYGITLDPAATNVNTAKTLTAYDLVSNGGTADKKCYGNFDYASQTATGQGYTTPCIHTNEEGDSVWYNYAIATAGTITGNPPVSAEATQDICPSGWKLPNLAQIQSIGDNSSTYSNLFTPVYGGFYVRGGRSSSATEYGLWWGSGYHDVTRDSLRYSKPGSLTADSRYQYYGNYVRCVAK